MSSLVPIYCKTLFKNEPAVRDARIIYSHHSDNIHHTLGNDFHKKAHIENYIGDDYHFMVKPDTTELYKIGIGYSEQVVITSGEKCPDVEEFSASLNKPLAYIENSPVGVEQYLNLLKKL